MTFTRKHPSIPVGEDPHEFKPEKIDVPPAQVKQTAEPDISWRSTPAVVNKPVEEEKP